MLITIIDNATSPNSSGPRRRANRIEIKNETNCLTNAPERSQKNAFLDLELSSLFKINLLDQKILSKTKP